jgi:hypothetical protein
VYSKIFLKDETIWLTQQKIADLFGIDRTVVTKHLKNIFDSNELVKDSACAKIAQVQIEGKRTIERKIEFYNLDAILSVGYRVNSSQATQFPNPSQVLQNCTHTGLQKCCKKKQLFGNSERFNLCKIE